MTNYSVLALQNLSPGSRFGWIGTEWEGLEWLDEKPCPTKEAWETEKARLITYQPLQACKTQAKALLLESDWSETPSAQMDLQNASEWVSYRKEIRKLFISPVESPLFPNKPQAVWKV